MSESDSWGKLRSALVEAAASSKYAAHILRIENAIAAGTLDTNLCYRGRECWLEGKKLDYLPVRDTTMVKVGISEEQEAFIIRRLLAGGRCFAWCHVLFDRTQHIKLGITGSGWFLLRFHLPQDAIRARAGIPFAQFLGMRYASAKLLATQLLAEMLHEC